MRKTLIAIATIAALAATPALAQGRSGGGGGNAGGGMGGGGFGGGMGAGPPISPPGQSGMDTRGASGSASEIASQRGAFGREFATKQHLSPQEYQALAQERRSVATQYAQAARSGRKLPDHSDRDIRTALTQDIDSWRSEFTVGRKEWQTARDQWIVDRASLTPEQWALRRADWFATRDAWIARNKAYAGTRSTTRTN